MMLWEYGSDVNKCQVQESMIAEVLLWVMALCNTYAQTCWKAHCLIYIDERPVSACVSCHFSFL
jgi:hypothetical protein